MPARPSCRAGRHEKTTAQNLHRGFNNLLVRPLRHNFNAGQNVRVKTQPVLMRADRIHFELFRAGQHGQNGTHQNKQILHCILLKMGMKKPRCACIVVESLRAIREVRPIVSECCSIHGQPVGQEECLHQAQPNRPARYTLGQ